MKEEWEPGSEGVARSPALNVEGEPVPPVGQGWSVWARPSWNRGGLGDTWRGWEVHSPDNDQMHFCAAEF